jgi:hypothetical protein
MEDAQRVGASFQRTRRGAAIGPRSKSALVERIRREFQTPRATPPGADHILAGKCDMLGYRGLRFDATVDPLCPSSPLCEHRVASTSSWIR